MYPDYYSPDHLDEQITQARTVPMHRASVKIRLGTGLAISSEVHNAFFHLLLSDIRSFIYVFAGCSHLFYMVDLGVPNRGSGQPQNK